MSYAGIAAKVNDAAKSPLFYLGEYFILVALAFKVAAVPFHMWAPETYEGAPTPVTGFMAACTKVAAFGALLRVLYVALPGSRWDWLPALAIVAALTMVIGSVIAVVQADVKRMLAYSSIAHAGFILVGLLALNRQEFQQTLERSDSADRAISEITRSGSRSHDEPMRNSTAQRSDLGGWSRGLGRPPTRRGRTR